MTFVLTNAGDLPTIRPVSPRLRRAVALFHSARAQWTRVVTVGEAALVALSLLSITASAFAEENLGAHWLRLASSADVIVLGECAAERDGWDESGGLITTTIQFRTHRFYKGEIAPTLTIKTLGGSVGDESMSASHGASLAAGEQVLLFLKRSEFGPYYVVAGGEAGKVRVEGWPSRSGTRPTQGTRAELVRLLNQSGE